MPSRRRFLAAGVAGLGATAGCLAGSDPLYAGDDDPETRWWSQPGFDHNATCYNPRQVGPRDDVHERWSLDVSGPSSRPVVADGVAYLPTAEALVAVDAASGEERWRETGTARSPWPQSVAVHEGTVFVATLSWEDPSLRALNAETGDRVWTFAPDGHDVTALLVHERFDELFAGDDRGNVYRLDPATGEVHWRAEVFGAVTHFARGIPELDVGTQAGEVHALLPDDGRHLWRRKLPGRVVALGTTNGGGTYASVFGGPTFELAAEATGRTEWSADVWSTDSFVLAGKSVFATGVRLVSLDADGGRRRWTGSETAQCGPAAAGDTVYVASPGRVDAYAFDGGVGVGGLRVGAKRWSHPVEGSPEQGIAVADGAVFVLTEGGEGESSTAYALESA